MAGLTGDRNILSFKVHCIPNDRFFVVSQRHLSEAVGDLLQSNLRASMMVCTYMFGENMLPNWREMCPQTVLSWCLQCLVCSVQAVCLCHLFPPPMVTLCVLDFCFPFFICFGFLIYACERAINNLSRRQERACLSRRMPEA